MLEHATLDEAPTPAPVADSRRLAITALLFLSGATGLVYEIVWSKHLANVLGSSGHAHAVVLGAFMGGLALGAFLLGSWADRVRSPLRLYGLLELGIGLYALIFPLVLGGLTRAYLMVAPHLSEGLRPLAKLTLAGAALAVPTVLMGGTVPALVRHFTHGLGRMRRELSALYAVNSLGASLGAFSGAVVLVPSLGLASSARLAALLNLLLGAAAVALASGRFSPGPRAVEVESAPEPASELPLESSHHQVRAALAGTALAGFTAMLYETTWIRLLSIVLGASTYAFTFILTAFILGIGLGSFWLMRRAERPAESPLRLFGWLQLFLAVSVCLVLPWYVRLPHLFWKAHHALQRSAETWPLYQGVVFLFCCAVLLLPAFLLGASFPAAARAATVRVAGLGRQLGGVYLWNTLGTIAGAVAGGLWLLPWLGMEGCFVLGVVTNLATAAIGLRSGAPVAEGALGSGRLARWLGPWMARARVRPQHGFAALALGLALLLWAGGGWSRFIANADAFRQRGAPFESFDEYRAAVSEAFEVLYEKDDSVASVLVAQGRTNQRRFLRINGKVDASNGPDVETQVLAGHLGILLHPRPVKRVLLVGAGAAITAGAILTHEVERVDLVELSPAVLEAARLFSEDNRKALDDPRLHAHVDDAKSFLALAPADYDLVVSVPSNPWVSGVSGLFSKDFFREVAAHLAPDGLLLQWVHTYESSRSILGLVVRTLRDTFPHTTSWLGPQDVLFVASRAPLKPSVEALASRLAARPEVKADLQRIDASDVWSILGRQLHSEPGLAELGGQGAVNTDDLNHLEYEAPVAFFEGRARVELPDERLSPRSDGRLALAELLERQPLTAEGASQLHRALARHPGGNAALLRSVAERWQALAPDSVAPRLALGRILLFQGEVYSALEVLKAGLALDRTQPDLVALYVRAHLRRAKMAHSTFGVYGWEVATLLAEAEAAHLGSETLRRARAELCKLAPGVQCPPDAGPEAGESAAPSSADGKGSEGGAHD